jgi:hypothetical protein
MGLLLLLLGLLLELLQLQFIDKIEPSVQFFVRRKNEVL